MIPPALKRSSLILLVLLGLVSTGCTEEDEELLEEIVSTVVYLSDPGIEQQDLNAVLNRWGDPACE